MMLQIGAEHRALLVNLAAWITLSAMIVFTSSKVATKWTMNRKFQSDDMLMIIAMFTAVGHCVAVAVQVQSGLGQPRNALDSNRFLLYEKSEYVSQFFYVFTIYIAKTAALQFLMLLARPNWSDSTNLRRITVKGITVFIVTFWTLFRSVFWIINGVIDVTTQLLIGLAPLYLLFNVHLPMAKKRLVLLSFTPNITTIPFTVLRLVYLYKVYHSSDTTIDTVKAALVTVLHANYCIIASCVPFLRPVVATLTIGLTTNDIRVPARSEWSIMDKSKTNPFAILTRGKRVQTRNPHGWTRFPASSDFTSTVTVGQDKDTELQSLERYGSQNVMIIHQTKTTVVSSDPRFPSG
ncbi:MAG: hypothetical protein ASARMPREDX12_005913 [Alectoria sarmentosa]|nr:MAG: hypothetical protein ASARMPREDX12_005913 [Alectoria sarmentosa]